MENQLKLLILLGSIWPKQIIHCLIGIVGYWIDLTDPFDPSAVHLSEVFMGKNCEDLDCM